MAKKNVKILISCHKQAASIRNSVMTPIYISEALSDKKLTEILRADTGDNISIKSPSYCELTAQYWAWKNLDANYYGFCHYRRYFNFSENRYPQDCWGMVLEDRPDESLSEKFGWNEESICRYLDGIDIITSPNHDVRAFPDHPKSVYEHYKSADYLFIKDVDMITDIIRDKYPEYHQIALDYFNGRKSRFCNMFIMRREIFRDYCEWLFDILTEFEARTDMSTYCKQSLRTPGHLAERLLNIYLLHAKQMNPTLQIKETQVVLFRDTEPQYFLEPSFKEPCIPIIISSSDYFAPIAGVCLKCIAEHSSPDFNYDIIVLETGMSIYSKKLLTDMLRQYSNISLRFYNVTLMLKGQLLKPVEHIGVETFYRFLIQDILPHTHKALYLDSDLIILSDVAELYSQELDGYLIAAARDPDFQGQLNMPGGTAKQYAVEELKLLNPYGYFQAGVLVMNLSEMRALHSAKDWLKLASVPRMYADQDVLNQCCQGRVKYLDMAWNVLIDCGWKRLPGVIEYAPATIYQEYMKAREKPNIIHYAGYKKPWQVPGEDFGELFWAYARKTPFYEILLYRMAYQKPIKRQIEISHKLRKFFDRLLPKGSRRREFVKNRIFNNVGRKIV